MFDWGRANVPLDGIYESDNVLLFSDRGEVRSGTRLLSASHADLPAVASGTGISASKSGTTITISAGYTLSSANIGDYFKWSDDGYNELITAVNVGGNSCTVTSSRTHDVTTTGRIRQEVNAAIWDKVNKKHVIQIGTKIYYADWDITSWTEAYCLSTTAPANTKSIMRQFGKNIYLWNSNGKYIIEMGATIPTVSRLNNTMIECPVSSVAETSTLIYGRRYTVTMIEMIGSYLNNAYNGNEVEHESSPWTIDSDGKDYAEIFTENKVGDEDVLLSSLQVPYSESGGTYTFLQEYTHYRLYGTKDIGSNGIDPASGKDNNPELYIHIEDIPIIKSFVVSTAVDGTVTASKGTFHEYDVGSTLYLSDGKSGTITAYTSSSVVTWDQTDVTTNLGATIGSSNAFVFSQSGTTVTASAGTPFDANSVGKRIFVSDGTLIVITEYTDSTHVEVADSTTRTSLGGGILVSPTGTSTANTRKFTDSVTDAKLSTRISKIWCKNRFWEPLPDCDIGVEIDGFFVSAVKGGKAIYETQLANEYFAGYYDPEFQVDTVPDSIQALRVYPSLLAAICSQSTTAWATEITITDSRPEVGLSSTFLAQKKPVDYQIGTMFPESIVPVHEGVDILFTNNCEIRLFNGRDYGPNLAEGKMMKLLRKLQPMGAASYDSIGGYRLWGTDGSLTSIGGVNRLPFPDVCYRFSIREEQGVIGGIKVSGSGWVQPPNGVNGYEIIDSGNRSLQVILDNITGKYYWISTYNGPTGSGLSKTFVDKDDTTGTGTEISWSISYGADTGRLKKYDIRHDVSNLTIDPDDPDNADGTGYDSEGFRDGLEIDFEAYRKVDEWSSAYATANDITKNGDITFDKIVEDKAIQIKISGNRSECVISELINYYTVFDHATTPTKSSMSEGDYQENLNTPVLWLSRHVSLYKNLATGTSITGTPTGVTGVDSKGNSGFQISEALDTISVTLSSGSVLFWADGTVALTIGGESVTLSSVGSTGGWTLYYATGITKSGTLTLTPSGTRKIEDVRAYNSEIDSDTRSYLYNDMVKSNGDNTMGLW